MVGIASGSGAGPRSESSGTFSREALAQGIEAYPQHAPFQLEAGGAAAETGNAAAGRA